MKRILIAAALTAALSPVFAGSTKDAPCPGQYITFAPKGQLQNFSMVIPMESKVIYADGTDETTYTVTSGKGKIRIRALYSTEKDLVQRIQEKKWELRTIDPSIRTIIDGEPVTIRASIKGTLLVYQYRDLKKKGSVLQRTLITSQGNFVYIIDCFAPIAEFYRYEQAFNIAMGGFIITGSSYTPSVKKPQSKENIQNAEGEKKPDIKVDQDELNSMGLKEDTKNDQNKEEQQKEPEQK